MRNVVLFLFGAAAGAAIMGGLWWFSSDAADAGPQANPGQVNPGQANPMASSRDRAAPLAETPRARARAFVENDACAPVFAQCLTILDTPDEEPPTPRFRSSREALQWHETQLSQARHRHDEESQLLDAMRAADPPAPLDAQRALLLRREQTGRAMRRLNEELRRLRDESSNPQ